MNSKSIQLISPKNGAAAESAEMIEKAADGAQSPAWPMEPANPPAKAKAAKKPGKAAAAKSGGGADGREDSEPPKCEVFSASEILVKHLTREVNGAPAFTGEWREVFLQALARAPIVSVAAKIAGVSRARALEARAADAEFARRWDDAMDEGADEIEAAAFRSAVFGEEKPVYHQGEVKGWTVEYSHAMRSTLLKSRRPEVFGDKEAAKGEETKAMTLAEFEKRVEEAMRN
jgi:hypothetical protein